MSKGEAIPIRTKSIRQIVIHCSDFADRFGVADVYNVAKYDVTPSPNNHLSVNGAFTISYHYFIEHVENEPTIYQCLSNSTVGWHAKGWNSISLGIAVHKKGEEISEDLKERVLWLTSIKCKELNLTHNNVYFHRELEGTGFVRDKDGNKIQLKTCPGIAWRADEFRSKVKELIINS